jgi:5-methyltetrahydropteroyltriglutamate--homocysteine methyltransferase
MSQSLPHRAEHVGSLLRSASLKAARAKRAQGAITPADLKEIEDQEILRLIAKQEEVGMQSVTDGEVRRETWHFDFLENLDGVEAIQPKEGFQFHGATTGFTFPHVVGRLGAFNGHPMLSHFEFVKQHARPSQTAKMTIPSPSALHFRFGRQVIDENVYGDMDAFYHDLGEVYAKAVAAFGEAGCRYLQLDEVYLAYLCDPEHRAALKARGDDPETLPQTYADLINKAVSKAPADMTLGMHLCRGNFRSTYAASGGYEPVAELLFNAINVQAYFMEFDTERAGGFEPLRFVPKGKTVVLGVVTSKSGKLEDRSAVLKRIDDAAKFVPLDQLCLSPQCGFASTEEGNDLAEEEQWAKLRLVSDIAREVWG